MFSRMFRVFSDIWDGTFSRGSIGFELWTVICEECPEALSELTKAFEVELFADASLGSEYVSRSRWWQN